MCQHDIPPSLSRLHFLLPPSPPSPPPPPPPPPISLVLSKAAASPHPGLSQDLCVGDFWETQERRGLAAFTEPIAVDRFLLVSSIVPTPSAFFNFPTSFDPARPARRRPAATAGDSRAVRVRRGWRCSSCRGPMIRPDARTGPVRERQPARAREHAGAMPRSYHDRLDAGRVSRPSRGVSDRRPRGFRARLGRGRRTTDAGLGGPPSPAPGLR